MKNSYSEIECIKPLPIHIMLITHNRHLLLNPLACITLLHTKTERVEEEDKKMVPHFNDKKRLRQIHTRVNYLAEECGFMDTDTPPSFKVHGLCICCVQTLQPHDKSEVDVSPKTQVLYIRCSG